MVKKLSKKLENKLMNIIAKYGDEMNDFIIGCAFIRDPFITDFRNMISLVDDTELSQAVNEFMKIAHNTFRWENYLEARTTAEKTFRLFYAQCRYPEDKLEEAVKKFIISFFNENIDENLREWQEEQGKEKYPTETQTEDDIDNIQLSRFFARLSEITDEEANKDFCSRIGVRYDYEQLHMCCWFSVEITHDGGYHSRKTISYSARTSYGRLLNPRSLLWIGIVMGADRDELRAASDEMGSARDNKTKCGIVRKHVPFDEIRRLYGKMVLGESGEA